MPQSFFRFWIMPALQSRRIRDTYSPEAFARLAAAHGFGELKGRTILPAERHLSEAWMLWLRSLEENPSRWAI
jgi:hypothetical protein